MGLRHL
jgi:transcriptional regulator CtsR